jgi:predicted RNA-binding protein YlxR (DUF448 family)
LQRTPPNENRHSPIRKCILSGEHGDRATLIRLALGPDGSVAPDIFAKAPGRGAWIGVTGEELTKAQAKGKLAGLLRRAFKTDKIELIDDLSGRIERGLEKAFLDRLGLEARAGHLILGAEKIDGASRSGQVRLLLHASDASADGSGKRDQAWRVGEDQEGSGNGGIKLPVDRDAISAALGRQNAVHIALIDQKAADRVMHHLGRWLNFKGCSNAPLDSGSIAPDQRGADADISAID